MWRTACCAQAAPAGLHESPQPGFSCNCLHPPPLQRQLDYIRPDYVHIMADGRITTTGGLDLVDQLELEGYRVLSPSP